LKQPVLRRPTKDGIAIDRNAAQRSNAPGPVSRSWRGSGNMGERSGRSRDLYAAQRGERSTKISGSLTVRVRSKGLSMAGRGAVDRAWLIPVSRPALHPHPHWHQINCGHDEELDGSESAGAKANPSQERVSIVRIVTLVIWSMSMADQRFPEPWTRDPSAGYVSGVDRFP
jgi:hypothetical protein